MNQPDSANQPVGVAIIGCGHVSFQYFEGCRAWDILELRRCADVDITRAQQSGDRYGVAASDVPSVLGSDDVDLIINLTPPHVHHEVTLEALNMGKHVYSEKPLAATLAEAVEITNRAREAGLLVGCAPDTFLGGALQTCRKILDDGWIGVPTAASAFVTSHGYEHWHPAARAFYKVGPMLDQGPYYVTALLHLLGPVSRVCAMAKRTYDQRTAHAGAERGTRFDVDVPTHVTGSLQFEQGAIATMVASWDVWTSHLPYIEIYGTEGSLSVPNPDLFGGVPRVRRPDDSDRQEDPPPPGVLPWSSFELSHSVDVGRGIGVADLAYAIRTGRPSRASSRLATHALEVMTALAYAPASGECYEMTTTCDRPSPLPLGLPPRVLDT